MACEVVMSTLHSLFLKKVKQDFIETIDAMSEGEWLNTLYDSYQQFEMMDATGYWTFHGLAPHQKFLLPVGKVKEELKDFVEQVYEGCQENGYLMNFLMQLNAPKDYNFNIPHLLAFAYTMDKINVLAREDIELLEKIVNYYQKLRMEKNFYRLSNILGIIKLHSIQKPTVLFIKAWKKGKLNKSFGRFYLTLNIFEAFLVDLCTGFRENAKSTLPLMFFGPNYRGYFGLFKNYIHGENSKFSEDGKAVEMYSPCHKEWADLYQTWNMALVAQFDQAPYLLVKLFIPSVSRYYHREGEYMHTRITALLLAMNFIDYAVHYPRTHISIKEIGPLKKKVLELWGRVNYKSSLDYKNRVTKAQGVVEYSH